MKRLKTCRSAVYLLLLTLTASGCSSESGKRPKGESPRDATQGKSDGATAGGLCPLFTKKEIEELLGAPVNAGVTLGTECHWDGEEGVYASIQVIREKDQWHWLDRKQAKGYEALHDMGQEAYVIPDQGGWNARALTDVAAVSVVLHGGKADRDRAVKLLRTLLERLK